MTSIIKTAFPEIAALPEPARAQTLRKLGFSFDTLADGRKRIRAVPPCVDCGDAKELHVTPATGEPYSILCHCAGGA